MGGVGLWSEMELTGVFFLANLVAAMWFYYSGHTFHADIDEAEPSNIVMGI